MKFSLSDTFVAPSVSVKSNSMLPPALQIAESVTDSEIEGEYDVTTHTWSDRKFALAGPKKHNEAM